MYSLEYLVDYLDDLYGVQAGDLVMTGTPKGVGKLNTGDRLSISIDDDVYQVNVL